MKTKTNKLVTPEPAIAVTADHAALASHVARHASMLLSHAVLVSIAVVWLTSAAKPAVDALAVVLVSV
jgi:hypothetical protein